NDGRLVTSAVATDVLWDFYPASVRRWIIRHGGLTKQMIYMEGRSMDGIVATCNLSTLRATQWPEPLAVHKRKCLWARRVNPVHCWTSSKHVPAALNGHESEL